jgi:hypothetical protein
MYIAFSSQILCAFTAMHILLVGEPSISFFYLTECKVRLYRSGLSEISFSQSHLAEYLLCRSQSTFMAGFAAFLWSVSYSVLF